MPRSPASKNWSKSSTATCPCSRNSSCPAAPARRPLPIFAVRLPPCRALDGPPSTADHCPMQRAGSSTACPTCCSSSAASSIGPVAVATYCGRRQNAAEPGQSRPSGKRWIVFRIVTTYRNGTERPIIERGPAHLAPAHRILGRAIAPGGLCRRNRKPGRRPSRKTTPTSPPRSPAWPDRRPLPRPAESRTSGKTHH